MTCPRCQAENPPTMKFCEDCGARLAATCPSCGAEVTSGKRFFGSCGAALVAAGPPEPRFPSPESYTPKHLAERIINSKAALEGERKQVTMLFADMKGGSMELLTPARDAVALEASGLLESMAMRDWLARCR